MISFVVQNFFNTPFLAKTQRYNNLVISMNTKLLYAFVKFTSYSRLSSHNSLHALSFINFLHQKFFIRGFFAFFKKLYSNQLGLMTINLTKSLTHKTFSNLNIMLDKGTFIKSHNHNLFSLYNIKYLQPITIVSFAFQKKTYNSLMVFVLFLLVSNYTPSQNSFKLYYSFILKSPNLSLYPFLNLFYFKLKQF